MNSAFAQNKTMEIWKPIPGWEHYEVSNLGRVRGVWRRKEWVMCLQPHFMGYRIIKLTKNKSRKNFFVHRLVAMAFIPNFKDYPVVNHKDLDKTNNELSNLEWCQYSENSKHYHNNKKF